MSRPFPILTLVGVLISLEGGVARADRAVPPPQPRQTLAILSVVGPADVTDSFEADLEQRLSAMPIRLITRSALSEQLRSSSRWTDGCVAGMCLEEVRAKTGAGVVLLAALTGSGTTFGYVVTLVRTDTGRVLDQEADRCDVCTETEAMTRVTVATMKLVNAIPDRLPDDAAAQGAAVDVAVNAAMHRTRGIERRRARKIGWGLTLSGLAVAGVGVVLYLASDDGPARELTAAGGGLALGGITVLAF